MQGHCPSVLSPWHHSFNAEEQIPPYIQPMEEKNSIEKATEHLKKFAETKLDLMRLDLSDKLSSTLSSVASFMLLGLFAIFIIQFLSIGVALWISNQSLGSSMGFLFVAGFYLLLVVVIYILRERLIKMRVVNFLLKKLHTDEAD